MNEASIFPPRHNFRGHPEFTRLLERIAHEIDPDQTKPRDVRVLFSHGGRHSTFSLRAENFELTRMVQASTDLGCIVCEIQSRRQYGFYVRCDDGELRGPIGSSCIFRHVLGVERAQALGWTLQRLVRRLTRLPAAPDLAMQDDDWDYDAYLTRLSLAYLLHGLVVLHARLTAEESADLQRYRNTGQALPAGLYAALRDKGDRMLARLAQQPLSQEPPYETHRDHPLVAQQPHPPVRFDPDVNTHPFGLNIRASWVQTEQDQEVVRLRLTRGELPYYRPLVLDLRTADECETVGRFFSALAGAITENRRKTARTNHLRYLGGVAVDAVQLHAWYGARMCLPTGDHGVWNGTRTVVLDAFEKRFPQRQAVRLYESDNGVINARSEPIRAEEWQMVRLGRWLLDQRGAFD